MQAAELMSYHLQSHCWHGPLWVTVRGKAGEDHKLTYGLECAFRSMCRLYERGLASMRKQTQDLPLLQG